MKNKPKTQPAGPGLPEHILEKMDGMDARPSSLAPAVAMPLPPRLQQMLDDAAKASATAKVK